MNDGEREWMTHIEGTGRLQFAVVVALALVVFAVPLYLWRRPRVDALAVPPQTSNALMASNDPFAPVGPTSGAPTSAKEASLEAKVVACHDAGPRKTPPERCDAVPELAKPFAAAVEQSASCVPKEAGAGTIVYALDVNFRRKSRSIKAPKDGRSIKAPKVVSACVASVRAKMQGVSLDGIAHEHTRYKLVVTATYGAPPR